jgi:hypothetical protein
VSKTDTYVTIVSHAVGNDRDGFRVAYDWDGRTFKDKAAAIENGFEAIGCDDFNIGVVRKGRLASFWWMGEQISAPPETLAEIGRECGLSQGCGPGRT